jgi:hypothetical protein
MASTSSWKWTTASGSLNDLTDVDINPEAVSPATPREGGFVLRNRWKSANLKSSAANLFTADTVSATDEVQPVNRLRVLNVPSRTFVKDVTVFAMYNATASMAPALSVSTTNSLSSSFGDGTALFAGAYKNKKATSMSSYAAASHLVQVTAANSTAADGYHAKNAEVFGRLPMTKATLALTQTLKSVDTSIASSSKAMNTAMRFMQIAGNNIAATVSAGSLSASTAAYAEVVTPPIGEYFPYGGYIYFAIGPYNTKLSSVGAPYASSAGVVDIAKLTASDTITMTGNWEVQANCNYVPEVYGNL